MQKHNRPLLDLNVLGVQETFMQHLDKHVHRRECIGPHLLLVEQLHSCHLKSYQVEQHLLVVPGLDLVPLEHPPRESADQQKLRPDLRTVFRRLFHPALLRL